MSIFYALIASLNFAVSHILIRRGLAQSNPLAGFAISILISAVALWSMVAVTLPLAVFWTHAIWYFAVGGLFASGLGRWLVYVSIDRLGVARSIPVVSTTPMFASILAVILVGEHWTLGAFFGTVLIICGVVVISQTHEQRADWRRRDLIFPLLGALSFSFSASVRKLGFFIDNLPLMASCVNATTGLVLAIAMVYGQGGPRKVLPMSRSVFWWFVAAGICNTTGMLANFYALSTGDIVIVEPLISTNPVLTVVLTAIFLRDVETVNLRVCVGVAFTFVGTLLLVYSRA
ncbi:MAG: DMT family transporter, partial [Deltaproteobacteria bacterium]|nr:DMT family transporter [Deltaproteobacteria bacterium]